MYNYVGKNHIRVAALPIRFLLWRSKGNALFASGYLDEAAVNEYLWGQIG